MPGIQGQVVFITGASSGIGAACARAFARERARLLLAARRVERIGEASTELERLGAPAVRAIRLDVRDAGAVEAAVDSLPAEWEAISVLVNNAGLSRGLIKLHEGDVGDWEEMIDTNVKGLLHVDRAVVPGMVSRGRGTVIHIASIAGRQAYPGGNVYCATKAAVRSLSEGLRLDLLGTGVRVANIDPGMVETEFSEVRFRGDRERATAVYAGTSPLTGDDVADVAVYVATRPDRVAVADVMILPTDQASALHIHRRATRRES